MHSIKNQLSCFLLIVYPSDYFKAESDPEKIVPKVSLH